MNTTELRQYLALKTRNDLTTFIHFAFQVLSPGQRFLFNWHVAAMAFHLQLCLERRIKRLIITVPPRSLKTICASVAFPAFALGRDPSLRIIAASYSSDLAGKNALDCRAVMNSPFFRQSFPRTRISREKNTEFDFVTTDRGFRYSTSIGGSLTGRGGDIIVIDDPLKTDDAFSKSKRSAANEWFQQTLYSRLDDKRSGVILVVAQRLHVDDLIGNLLPTGEWTHLNLPAITEVEQSIQIGPGDFYKREIGDVLHEEREPKEVLDKIRLTLGNYHFSAQYQQAPVPLEGELIKWPWFRSYDELPAKEHNDEIVQSWDTASKAEELSDFSACSTWHIKGNDYYLIDLAREKLDYPSLRRRAVELSHMFSADSIIIEDKGSGTALIQDLRSSGMDVPYPIAFMPEADKVTRMSTQSAKLEAGHVFLPRRAEWLEDLRSELLQFPYGRYDDQVDSISQFLNWIDQRQRNRVTIRENRL